MSIKHLCALGLSVIKIHDPFPQGPYQATGEKARMSIIKHKKDALVKAKNDPLTKCVPEIQPIKIGI